MKRARVTCWVGHQQQQRRRVVECIHSVKKVRASTAAADYYNYRVLLLRIHIQEEEEGAAAAAAVALCV